LHKSSHLSRTWSWSIY